jgi:hypothetical protein
MDPSAAVSRITGDISRETEAMLAAPPASAAP